MSYMVRLCAKTHDSEKGLRIFNDLQLDGFVEHSKPYNAVIAACAATKRYSAKAIEYWHMMHAKAIKPDDVTYTYVLKACSMLGDTVTAYDVLQEMKLNGYEPNEHIFNQLIKVYAGAVTVAGTKHEHVQMYIKDAWAIFELVEKNPKIAMNANILNQMVTLYAGALKPEELEAKVLPLFDKFSVPFNVYTFQELIKLFYNTRDLDRVYDLYNKLQE